MTSFKRDVRIDEAREGSYTYDVVINISGPKKLSAVRKTRHITIGQHFVNNPAMSICYKGHMVKNNNKKNELTMSIKAIS